MTFQKLGAQFNFLYKAEVSRLHNVTFEFHVLLTLTKEFILLITDLTVSIRHIRTVVIHTSKDLTKHVLKPPCLPWQLLLPHYRGPKLTFSFHVNAITSHQYQQEKFYRQTNSFRQHHSVLSQDGFAKLVSFYSESQIKIKDEQYMSMLFMLCS